MAATNLLSDLSWMTPALPGLTNSRVSSMTFGGPCMSCAAANRLPATARDSPNRAGLSIFIFWESSLICSEFRCDGEGKREAQALQGKRLSIPAPRDVKEFLILHSVSAGRIHPGITNPALMPFARAVRADSIRVELVRRAHCDLHAAMRNCSAER